MRSQGKHGAFCGVSLVDAVRQGTPAFVADALARYKLSPVEHFPFEGVKTLNVEVDPHPQADRHHSDKDFLNTLQGTTVSMGKEFHTKRSTMLN